MDDVDEQLAQREWIIEYWNGKYWELSGNCRRESGNPRVLTLTACVEIVKKINAQWDKYQMVSPDNYRLRHFKNKKDVIPACVLLDVR